MLSRDGLPLDRPPGHVVARPCCRARLPARRLPRRRLAQRPAVASPRGAHAAPRRRSVRAQRRLGRGRQDARPRPGRAFGARTRRAGTRSRRTSSVAGATETVLALEERALVAGLRADANRVANADHANLVRQSRSARAQLEAATALRSAGVLAGLAPTLQEAAELRLRHPSLSLRELAARADPPVTKAAMAGRLARLVALAAEELQRPTWVELAPCRSHTALRWARAPGWRIQTPSVAWCRSAHVGEGIPRSSSLSPPPRTGGIAHRPSAVGLRRIPRRRLPSRGPRGAAAHEQERPRADARSRGESRTARVCASTRRRPLRGRKHARRSAARVRAEIA